MSFLRTVVAVWILGTLVLASGYCGMLKAAMTRPALTNPINSFMDLLESGLRPEMAQVAEYEGAISTNQDPLVKAVYDSRIEIEFEIEPKVRIKLIFICQFLREKFIIFFTFYDLTFISA